MSFINELQSIQPVTDPEAWRVKLIADTCISSIKDACRSNAKKGMRRFYGELATDADGDYRIRDVGSFIAIDGRFTLSHMEKVKSQIEDRLKNELGFSRFRVSLKHGTCYTQEVHYGKILGGTKFKRKSHPGVCLCIELEW